MINYAIVAVSAKHCYSEKLFAKHSQMLSITLQFGVCSLGLCLLADIPHEVVVVIVPSKANMTTQV